MKRQCPKCESMDVKLNEKGQLICFTCFNISSTDSARELSARSDKDIPPFPAELERKHEVRRTRKNNSSVDSTYKRVVA
jgi:hypothetical protein